MNEINGYLNDGALRAPILAPVEGLPSRARKGALRSLPKDRTQGPLRSLPKDRTQGLAALGCYGAHARDLLPRSSPTKAHISGLVKIICKGLICLQNFNAC